MVQGTTHFAEDEPVAPPHMTMRLPEDVTSLIPAGQPYWTAQGLVGDAVLLAVQTIDDLYGAVLTGYGASKGIEPPAE
jgi:hypothetical protein